MASRSNMLLPDNEELEGAINDGSSSSYRNEYNNEGLVWPRELRLRLEIFRERLAPPRCFVALRSRAPLGYLLVGIGRMAHQQGSILRRSWVDQLKLKLSYGEQGNDNIGNFRYTDTYTIVNSGGVPSAQPNTLGNRNISWEKGGNLNYGIDFSIFNERLSGTIEGFYRKTTDMLFSFPSPSYGYTQLLRQYRRHDQQRSLKSTSAATSSAPATSCGASTPTSPWYKNKVTRLPDERKTMTVDGVDGYSSGNYFYGEGEPLYTWRIKRWAGVNPETGAARWWKNVTDDKGNVTGQEMTETYSEGDFYLCGTALPISAYGGFGTSLNAYGFDLSLDFTYQLGGKVYDNTYASLMSPANASSKGLRHAQGSSQWLELDQQGQRHPLRRV